LDGSLVNKAQDTLVAAPCGLLLYIVPSSVTAIGDNAFDRCRVTDVTIPSSVVTIAYQAFLGCEQLKSVTIPSSVTSIGINAFAYTGLTSVKVPASVTSIGDAAFVGCSALTEIAVDPTNSDYSSVSGVLFDKAQTTLVEAPGAIASYVIPASVTTIGKAAFAECAVLTSISIPSTVTSIGAFAFNCAGLTSVTMQAASPPTLAQGVSGQGVFDCNQPQTYPIHVPSGAVPAYDLAPVWSGYASRFVTP
jgi:hypothetical protein